MTARDDLDRQLDAYLRDGPTELPEPSYYAVRDRSEVTRQRAVIGPWRLPDMNRFVPIAVGAAAVVVALVLGSQVLGTPSGGIGGAPSTAPTATPAPSPTAAPSPSAADGLTPGSTFVLTAEDRPIGQMPMQRIEVTAPAQGWQGAPGDGILTRGSADGPDGAGMIAFFGDLYVYGDPCRWSTTRPDAPATTVDEIVAALAAQASRDASAPVDVTLDGYPGKAITLQVSGDADFGTCDRGIFGTWGLPGADQTPMRYQQDPGQIDEVWVIDVDGTPAVIDWSHYPGTPPSVVDELRTMVESISFG